MNNATEILQAAEGVVGIAPNARILAYKVCGPDGHCSDFAITQAIDQAITDGAKVINMSLGGADYSQSLNDSVQAAWAAGLVIIAGAGNDGNTNLFYPAAFENVVSVGATDEDDLRASFSNYGNWVDIAAPGNVILSTYLMSGCSVSTTPGDIGCYAFNSGTSMATPHVSGAAALVWSRSDITSNWQVVDALTHGADASGVSAGADQYVDGLWPPQSVRRDDLRGRAASAAEQPARRKRRNGCHGHRRRRRWRCDDHAQWQRLVRSGWRPADLPVARGSNDHRLRTLPECVLRGGRAHGHA
jgi:subtilisin family serine protease